MDNIEKYGLSKVIQSLDLKGQFQDDDDKHQEEIKQLDEKQLSQLSLVNANLKKLEFVLSKLLQTDKIQNNAVSKVVSSINNIHQAIEPAITRVINVPTTTSIANTSNTLVPTTTSIANTSNAMIPARGRVIEAEMIEPSSTLAPTRTAPQNNAPGNAPSIPELPDMAAFRKGIMLGILPKKVIDLYIGGIQRLIDGLSTIKVKTVDSALEPVFKLLSSLTSFSEFNLTSSFASIVKLRLFFKGFSALFKGIDIAKMSNDLAPLKKISELISKPLEDISSSLDSFANVKWVKVILGSAALKGFISMISKIPAAAVNNSTKVLSSLANKLEKPLEKLGKVLSDFGDKLKSFFGGLLKGALAIAALGASLIPLAFSLKMFKDVEWSSVGKLLTTLPLIAVTGKILGGMFGQILKGSLAIAALGASILPLAYSLKMMESVGIGTVGVLAAALTVLGLAAAAVGSFAPLIAIGAGVLALLGASVIPLAYGLKMLSEANPETLGDLILPMLGLAAAGVALIAGAPGLLVAGFALIPFALGVKALSMAIDGVNVDVLKALPMALVGLAGAAWVLAASAPALLISGIALIPFALGVKALSAAIEGVNVDVLKALPEALIGLADAASELAWSSISLAIAGGALVPFAAGVKALSMALDGLNVDILKSLPQALTDLAESAETVADSALSLVVAGLALIPFAGGVKLLSMAIGDNENMSSFFKTFGDFFKDISPQKIYDSAKGIIALSGAIAAFGAAQASEGLGNLVGRLLRFGADSPLEQFKKFAEISAPLDIAAKAISTLAEGIKQLNELDAEIKVLADFPFDELEDLAESIEGKAIIQIVTNGSAEQAKAINEQITGKAQPTLPGAPGAIVEGAQVVESVPAIANIPNQTGSTLSSVGPMGAAGNIVINNTNNSGGNVSTVNSSNVNSTSSPPAPIITGSAMALF